MLNSNLKLNKTMVFQAFMLVMLMIVGYAMAHADPTATDGPNIENIHQTIVGTSDAVMKIIMLVAGIAGFAFVAMAMFSFKAASDSAGQQNNNLQKGVVKLVLGGALLSLPFILSVSQNSVLTGAASTSGLKIPSAADVDKARQPAGDNPA